VRRRPAGASLVLAAFLVGCSAKPIQPAALGSPASVSSLEPPAVAAPASVRPVAPAARPAALPAVARSERAPLQSEAGLAPAGPAIISASAFPSVVHGGDDVTWDVRTTSDVVAVDAQVQLASFPLQRVRPGRFGLVFHVPAGVPPAFHGSYAVELTARTSSGASATRRVELRFE
jgi:hypothetical protein